MKNISRGLAVIVTFIILLGSLHTEAYSPAHTRITLRDLGVLQLAAHDLFRVDRDLEENLENDMLDLSTVFDHGDNLIEVGGEIRNSENVAVFSVATGYAHTYLDMVQHGTAPEEARERMVRHFHRDLRDALRSMIDGRLPEYTTGPMTMTDDLAFRVIHDFLPGTVMVNETLTPILSPSLFRHALTDSELWAESAVMDGAVDEAFRNITFFTPEGFVVVDLIERDHSFAEQFNTDFSFQHFLDESSDGSLDFDEDATRLILDLIAKGMGNYHAYIDALEENGGHAPATTTDSTGEDTTESGEDGTDGDDGANGADGTNGTDGDTGTDGSDGMDGTTGTDVTTPTTESSATAEVTQSVNVSSEPERAVVRDSRSTRDVR